MIIEHFILARDSSIDRDRNSLSVFDFIEEIQIQAPAGTPIQVPIQALAILAANGELEPAKAPVKGLLAFSVHSPRQEPLVVENLPVEFNEGHRRTRIRLQTFLPIRESGVYVFRAALGSGAAMAREVRIPVRVVATQANPPQNLA